MVKVKTKPGVELEFSLATLHMLNVLAALARYDTELALPTEIVITAGTDGKHAHNSRHYRAEALDIRSKNFRLTSKEAFRARLERALGPKFRVLLEGLGTANEHFHAQVKKGASYP